jgi:hypothetical protein
MTASPTWWSLRSHTFVALIITGAVHVVDVVVVVAATFMIIVIVASSSRMRRERIIVISPAFEVSNIAI